MSIIEAKDLCKEFKQYERYPGFFGSFHSLVTTKHTVQRAVNGISLSIEQGEAVGYLGPNGAGKSTMIKMLTGILVPTSGFLAVKGKEPYKHRRELALAMGVVFGQRTQLVGDLPLIDSFDLHRHIYRLTYEQYRKNLSFCEELLGMRDFIGKPVRQLSLGQRMRGEIAIALLHNPDILFLDEPTIGLDLMAKDSIREFLRVVNKERKVTIILTTHDLKDIEEICPRILIVNQGSCVYDGSVQNLKASIGGTRKVTIHFAEDPGVITIQGITLVRDDGRQKTYEIEEGTTSAFDLVSLIAKQHQVVDMSLAEADIEDVIRSLYKQLADGQTRQSHSRDQVMQG